jgi:hypothetical protein
MHGGEVIVPIVFFALVFGIVYIAISSRNKERMALIEKGADASIFARAKTPGSFKWALVVGILSVGIAIGVFLGAALDSLGMDDEVAFPAAIFLCGGAALAASYFISKRTNGANK